MTKAKTQRYIESLEYFRQPWRNSSAGLQAAICLTKLEDYPGALAQFRSTLAALLLPGRSHWRSDFNVAKVWNLVDTYVLSQCQVPLADMLLEVESHRRDSNRNAPPELYSYALMSLLTGQETEALSHLPGILARPKVKQYFPTAKVIQALSGGDPGAVNDGLTEVLSAHQRVARYGAWRRYPEGYLCLPAMSLSLIARRRGMTVTVESEYLSLGYQDYLGALPEAQNWPRR